MTQEEKLEEAKRLYETANADQRYVLESLFPELRESEDERIRKALLEHIVRIDSEVPLGAYHRINGVDNSEIIDWLEKQGKQKSQRMISAEAKEAMYDKPAWSEEDEAHINSIIDYLLDYKLLVYEEDINVANGVQKEIDWLNSLKQRIGG